jgi:hypothetical protein
MWIFLRKPTSEEGGKKNEGKENRSTNGVDDQGNMQWHGCHSYSHGSSAKCPTNEGVDQDRTYFFRLQYELLSETMHEHLSTS